MRNRVLVVTDLGHFKAFRIEENELPRSRRLRLLDDYVPEAGHLKLSEIASDKAGGFAKGGAGFLGKQDADTGERHNIGLEMDRRLIRDLARRIEKLVQREKPEGVLLAADNEISRPLMEALHQEVREKIEKSIHANLTKADEKDLLGRI